MITMRILGISFVLMALVSCADMEILSEEEALDMQDGHSSAIAIMGGSDPLSMVFPRIGTFNPGIGTTPALMSGSDLTWFNHCRISLDSTKANREKLLAKHFEYYEAARKSNSTAAELIKIQNEIRSIMRDIDIVTPSQCK